MSWREWSLSGLREMHEDPPWLQPEAQAECVFLAGSDGSIYSNLSYRMRYACGFADGWSSPSVLSSDGNVDGMMLQDMYSDIPPR